MVRSLLRVLFLSVLVIGCGDSSDETPATDDPSDAADATDTPDPVDLPEGCTVLIEPGEEVQSAIQLALIDAVDGDSICFAEGTYNFTDEISLSVSGVTVRSAVAGSSVVFEFGAQEVGANGMSVTGDRFTIDGITIMNAPGDGLRMTACSGVTVRNCIVGWERDGDTEGSEKGAYGLYPVGCTDVLIEDSIVFGAVDAGFYVGQSSNIIVRRNEAYGNVAGIEIENSSNAEVYDNYAHDNTAGILVFDLPELPVSGGEFTEVHNNRVENNNVENFAPPGFTVAAVPSGTGMILAASKGAEVHDNTISGHVSTGIAINSIFIIDDDYEDDNYDPYAQSSYVYDNELVDNGMAPRDLFMGVAMLINGGELGPMPQIIWDGYVNPEWDNSNGDYTHCIVNNGDSDFLNCDWENQFANTSTDLTPHNCTRETYDPIEF